MTESIQARQTECCQGSAVTGEETPLKMPLCPSGLQCCSALVVSVVRSCHVIWSRWSGQGGYLSRIRTGCQTSCSSNKDCHSNDHSVSLTSDPYCYKKQREGPAGMVGRMWFKCAVFTSIRQARWRCPSEPIRIVVVGGEYKRGTARALKRPSRRITGLPLIASCHIDENALKTRLIAIEHVCNRVCVCVCSFPHIQHSWTPLQFRESPSHFFRVTITFIPIAASFNTSAHCHVALLISPVILFFVGGEGRGGVAYQMQNSTPAVPKHPHWVQISAPLLPFFPLSNTPRRQKGDNKFFHNKFHGNQNKNASSNLAL